MDETKIEQVEAQAEEVEAVEAPAEEVEAEEVEAVEVEAEEAEAEEVEAEAEEAEEAVAEGCEDKCDACKVKKETEDDEDEKKVAVKEGLQAEHEAKQRKEIAKEQSKDITEELFEIASEMVTDKVMEAIANLPIEEGISEEDAQAREEEIIESGQQLLADITAVLEEMVNNCTVELNGAQVEVKDFVGTGGKVGMGLPAGINPPEKPEDDESEKKVVIKAYHEGAEEIDYQAKYAESEALIDDLVATVENTATKYKELVENYNAVVAELQAYKISESYGITVDDAADMLIDYSFQEVCEEFERQEAGEEMIIEGAEDKAEEADAEADDKEDKAEEKEEKKEEKKAEEQEKALEEIKESAQEEIEDVEGAVIDESVEAPKIRAFSVFASKPISESKKARKAFSVFAD